MRPGKNQPIERNVLYSQNLPHSDERQTNHDQHPGDRGASAKQKTVGIFRAGEALAAGSSGQILRFASHRLLRGVLQLEKASDPRLICLRAPRATLSQAGLPTPLTLISMKPTSFKKFDVHSRLIRGDEPLPLVRARIDALTPGHGVTAGALFRPAPRIAVKGITAALQAESTFLAS